MWDFGFEENCVMWDLRSQKIGGGLKFYDILSKHKPARVKTPDSVLFLVAFAYGACYIYVHLFGCKVKW